MDLIRRQDAIDAMATWDWQDLYLPIHFKQLLEELPSVQSEQRWIPCSERLPEDDTEVIVSCTDDSGDSEFSYTTTGWHFKGIWVIDNARSYFVRAWMPLPETYKENENG